MVTNDMPKNILLSAYACEPDKGSEPGVGWNWTKQIARFHNVWVITRANNRDSIERALTKAPMSNVRWIYFDLPWWTRFWKRGQYGVHLYYYLWQIGAYLIGRGLHKNVGFDLVHHLTFGTYWSPSFLALLPIPFVWGPLGGGESAPKAFYKSFSTRGVPYERSRDITRWIGERNPFVRMNAKRAEIAFAKAQETANRLLLLGGAEPQLCSESGIASEDLVRLSKPNCRNARPFCFISLGRLLHWKGFHLSIKAFTNLLREAPESEYYLIGDGPERRTLEALVAESGSAGRVFFCGNLPRHQVFEKIRECDVLVHPSLHDSGGWVCLEAMAAGRPVICLDLGGPASQVTEETGRKIPAISPEQAGSDK
jgi:glycosyltransferase involved in cell wall biosynthesis